MTPMEEAQQFANDHSDDPKRKVGVMLRTRDGEVLFGTNKFADELKRDLDPRYLARHKDLFIEHAERNALQFAAMYGRNTRDSTMWVTWYPCAACARAIARAKVKRLVCGQHPDTSDPKWGKDFEAASLILSLGGVEVVYAC